MMAVEPWSCVISCWACCRGGDAVVAATPEALDAGELGEAARSAAAAQHRDEIDGLGDQGPRDRDDGFLNELLEAAERADSGAGVDGADSAGMAGAPGLQKIERLGAAHLHEVGERGDAVLGAHGDEIGRAALKLARVLDEDDAIGRLRHFGLALQKWRAIPYEG